MDKPRLTAAILIISDTASQDPPTDKAGDILSDVIAIHGNDQWNFTKREIVADDVFAIQRAVAKYCDGEDYVNVLITTGGTGFATKDRTPEAINPLIHRHAPGLVHSHSHSHGQGGHAIPRAHTRPEQRPISNDPRAGPTSRYRESPYPMLAVEDAVQIILEQSPTPEPIKMPLNGSLVGYVLAEDVQANEPVPAYRASIVDGYAVIVSPDGPSTKGVFPVDSVSHAAPGEIPALHRGQIARITTGAPLPPGANSVVMVEDTVLRSVTDDGREEKVVEILTDQVKPDENIREVGSDIKEGEVIMRKGEEITAVGGELGLLASVGKAEVLVYRKPIVGVLSTGDEIVMHDRSGPLQLGEVRDCNRPTLMAAIKGWGFPVVDYGIAKDKPGSLEEHLRGALRNVDVIVTSGGVSMGELDLLKPTLERSLGGTIHFGRVSMKPGKPTTFATVPLKSTEGDPVTKLVFSLPGNPASALVTSHLFVLPSLRYSSGREEPHGLPTAKVVLEEDVRCDPKRPEYHRVSLNAGADGFLHAYSTGGQRSSKITSLRKANGLLCLPAEEGSKLRGEMVDALLMGGLSGF
ncbi:gephyrin, partial [Lecanoromycetidae sp. Uapishka_2]